MHASITEGRKLAIDTENQAEIIALMRAMLSMTDSVDTIRECANACITALGEVCTEYTELEKERDELTEKNARLVKQANHLVDENRMLREGHAG